MSVTQFHASIDGTVLASTASTILPTPQKRKRLSPSPSPEPSATLVETPRPKDREPLRSQSLRDRVLECRRETSHSSSELYKWTFNQSSVAPVRVKHVFQMDCDEDNARDFYWMGRVPCRTVKVVGIVVGIDEFDNTTRFKLDDGTGVIDCDFKHSRQSKQLTTPTKRAKLASKYVPPETSSRQDKLQIPKVVVGSLLSVQGRIFQGRGRRYLHLEAGSFCLCKSANEEPQYWMEVLRLCREYYYLPEAFVIPAPDQQFQITAVSPSTTLPTLSIASSPVSISSPSGSEVSSSSTASPRHPRLRHPSRLHSRDLTDVTFRIYLKHYMDFAPPYDPPGRLLPDGDEEQVHFNDFNDPFATPTPKSRYRHDTTSFDTPKAGKQPRVSKLPEEDDEVQYGFTLSYLRRVPVLAEMARAVVRAEGKQREKEKRKREKGQGSQRTRIQGLNAKAASMTTSKSASSSSSDPQSVARNMKRLFQKTIRDLHREGSIIIWTGPSRSCEHAFHADGDSIGSSGGLWRTGNRSLSHSSAAASTAGDSAHDRSTRDEDLTAYLSEPNENEESYQPVTPRLVAPHVMRALCTLTGIMTGPGVSSRKGRRPTVDELTTHLQNSDARWANIGSWDVGAALEWLDSEDRVFKADGRWAVCS